MKVSVLITTYNHEKYIGQTIDSVLMQQVNFDYEIVIGEDCSTDRTREIVLDYQSRHPDKIRVLLRERVDAERERALGLGGKTNFVKALESCRGQYVALLDGDDYWLDPYKLQKQAEFLDTHSECSICFHDVLVVREDGDQEPERFCDPNQKEISTIEDLLEGNFIQTCSTMYRQGLFDVFPDWFYTSKVGDWPLHIMNARRGKVGYLNKVMAAYRVHPESVWSSRTVSERVIVSIALMEHVDAYLALEYHDRI